MNNDMDDVGAAACVEKIVTVKEIFDTGSGMEHSEK
jgi:hypothetical protein